MTVEPSGAAGSARKVKGFPVTLLVVLAVLAVAGFLARDRIGAFLDRRNSENMAVRIQGEMNQIRMSTNYYVAMNGGPGALTQEVFDDEGRGQGQLFDPTFTNLERPVPPPAALRRADLPPRYGLVVDDLLGDSRVDRIVVLRGVTDEVCLAFQRLVGNPADPLRPDPENRYAGSKGCTREAGTDELVLFDVLHTR